MLGEVNPGIIDGEWWAQYVWEPYQWKRSRVLRYVGINNGMFMFTVFPSKLWVLMSEQEVKSQYQQGTLKAFVLKGGKS